MSDIEAELAHQAEVAEIRKALRKAQIDLSRAKSKGFEFHEAVVESCRDAYLSFGRSQRVEAPSHDRRKRRAEAALWHVTDLQTGKKTVSYDMETMDRRLQEFAKKAINITAMVREVRPVRHCQVLLGGDMVENTNIFPGQAWEVEATTFNQLLASAQSLEVILNMALGTYETVAVTCEPGNHGRIAGRRDGVPKGDNWDRILYQVVSERFTSNKRISFESRDHWFQRFSIGKYESILVHGDEFKSFGGNTPVYGILKKVNAWKGGVIDPFKDCYVGHYHNHNDLSLAAGGMVYMTGSTESDNEFAREFVAASAVPSQRLHFVDPEEGRVTSQYKIELT